LADLLSALEHNHEVGPGYRKGPAEHGAIETLGHVEIVDQDVPPRGSSTHCLPPIKNLMPLLFHLPPTEPGEFFSRAAYTGITSSEVSSEASRKRPHVGQLKTPSSLACSSVISSQSSGVAVMMNSPFVLFG